MLNLCSGSKEVGDFGRLKNMKYVRGAKEPDRLNLQCNFLC